EGLPEDATAEEIAIVAQRHEAEVVHVADRVEVEVGETQREPRHDGSKEEEPDQQQRRRDEEEGGAGLGLHRYSIKRRFSNSATALASSAASAAGTGCAPRAAASPRSKIELAICSHSGTFGSGMTCSSCSRKAGKCGSFVRAGTCHALRRAGR